ncbi:MAG: VanZ family protein [Bacteroidia bacterium]|jgi:hypothetical protein
MKYSGHIRLYILPYLWAGFILFATIANVGTLKRLQFTDLFTYDKPIHMFLFSTQAYLWIRARAGMESVKIKTIRWICILVAIYGFLTEVFQSLFTTTRQFDIYDWIADALGCIIVYTGYYFYYRKREIKQQSVRSE